jgi:hypothetical protein
MKQLIGMGIQKIITEHTIIKLKKQEKGLYGQRN